MKDPIASAAANASHSSNPRLATNRPGRSASHAPLRLAGPVFIALCWLGCLSFVAGAADEAFETVIGAIGAVRQSHDAANPATAPGHNSVDPSDSALEAMVTERNNPYAALELGNRFFSGGDRSPDYARAVEWWNQAKTLGSSRAAYNLGVAYLNGYGAEKNLIMAEENFRYAAEDNLAAADFALGVMALTGKGRRLDYVEAGERFQRAADRGHRAARFNLGLMFERGIGVAKDPEKARQLIAVAERDRDDTLDVETNIVGGGTEPKLATHNTPIDAALNDSDWVRAQDPKRFTLQLVSGESREAIQGMLANVSQLECAIFSKILDGQRRFVGVAGTFDSVFEANGAVESLPEPLRRNKPFAIRFKVVQSQIE